MKKTARIALASLCMAVIIGSLYILISERETAQAPSISVTTAMAENPAQAEKPAPEQTVVQADETPATAAQSGINAIPFHELPAREMSDKYDFVAELFSPMSLDGTPIIDPLPVPETVKIAKISDSTKKLDFLILFVDHPDYCHENGCHFEVHVKRENEWPQMIGTQVTAESYYETDETGFSFIFCDDGAYRRWRMEDGALDRPLPLDAPGYFVPQKGIVSDSRITGTCPGAPAETP